MIRSIGVDVSVVRVGVTPEGAMESPEGREDTGWYERGALPGDVGSAVIAGHSGCRTVRAVFDDLEQLKPGDVIYIVDEAGTRIEFRVRESRLYRPGDAPHEVFVSDGGATSTSSPVPERGTAARARTPSGLRSSRML